MVSKKQGLWVINNKDADPVKETEKTFIVRESR